MNRHIISRRTILASTVMASTAALAGTGLLAPTRARAQSTGLIKLGILMPKQGTFAELGEGAANGAMLTLELAGSKILGRPAKAIWLDDPNPQTSQINMQKLIDEEKVSAVIGGATGATALAVSAVALRAKMPVISISGATALTGASCNRYTFRTMVPAGVAVRALAPTLLGLGKKWYFLMPDYAFGQDVYESYKAILTAAGGQEVGHDKTPLGTTDFSGYILKIRQAKPDVVVTALSGNDLPAMLKQYAEFGMKDGAPITSPIITDTDIIAAGASASGIFGKPWHYKDPMNSAEDQAFTAAYIKKFDKPPHANAYVAALSMRLLLAAIEKSGSVEPGAIVTGLETVRFDEGGFPIYFRPWDHQLARRTLVVKIKPVITEPWDSMDVLKSIPTNAADLDALYGTQQESVCKMGTL